MTERSLPPGWAWTTLGEICLVTMGQSPPGDSIVTEPRGMPFLQGKAEFGSHTPTFRKWTTQPVRTALKGSVLLSVRAPVGAVNIAPVDCSIGRGLASLRASELIDDRYLYHFAVASKSILEEKATGTTFSAVGGPTVRGHRVPLPPLPEQRRIVDVLEDHLSRLDAAERSLATATRRLKPLRASSVILDRADYGQQSGAERLDQVLSARAKLVKNKRRTSPALPGYELQLPPGWITASIDQLSWDIQYGTSSKTGPATSDSDVPVLRMGNIQDGDIESHNLKYLPTDDPTIDRLFLETGDLLFNRTNSAELVGKTAVFRDQPPRATFASYLIRCRPVPGVSAEWISHIANGPIGRRYVASVMSQQVGQANVNGTKLASMPIPIAPAQVEMQLLEDISESRATAKRLRNAIESTNARSVSLRRSLLRAAFAGELVDQDPSDEPADVALAKLRAAAMSSPQSRRARGKSGVRGD